MAKRRPKFRQRIAPVVRSAYFWYALLAVAGACVLATGTALEYGLGHGLIVFGVLSVAASEMVRRGMMRA